MEQDWKEQTAPTLVFDFPAEEPAPVAPVPEPQAPAFDESILSEEERQQVEAFSRQIDLKNSAAILNYGTGTQKKMADFSESALDNVRTKDLGEVGDMISGLVTELKSFDVEEE